MKKRLGSLFFPVLLCLLNAQQVPTPRSSALVFTHVTVIDGTGAAAKPDVTVIITGDRISRIGRSSTIQVPQDAQVVEARGKFLIPGLWDMHVHWSDTDYLPLFLANGVTGIRIMSGQSVHQEWRRQSETGQLLVPHLFLASAIVDGPKPFWPGSVSVSTQAEARQAVVQAKRGGADFVKVYTFLPREEYFAIADEARKEGISFAGHVPLSATPEEASAAGQKSIEHLTGLLPACSSRSAEFFQAAQADLSDELTTGVRTFWGGHFKSMRQAELDDYSPDKAAALFAAFRKNGTWQCPTLTLWRSIAYIDDPSFTNDPRIRYMPRWARQQWTPQNASDLYGPRSPADMAFAKKEFQKQLELVGTMQKAGVAILAGTDTSNAFCMPGFSLHDELGLLVKAGLTPMQAVQTATLNPARFLGRERDLGTIEEGKIADMVLLNANPLDDITNTTKIASVIYGGRLFPRVALDHMLSQVEVAANRQPISEVMMKTIQEKDVAAAIRQYGDLKSTQPTTYDFSENELVSLGYQLLSAKKISDAIEIFKLSVQTYPNSYNTYDSLAEAYMDNGNADLAIQNYQKSLQLNPGNTNAIVKLKKLNPKK
jgi:imidazolonepropionase-like amidohydrolase